MVSFKRELLLKTRSCNLFILQLEIDKDNFSFKGVASLKKRVVIPKEIPVDLEEELVI